MRPKRVAETHPWIAGGKRRPIVRDRSTPFAERYRRRIEAIVIPRRLDLPISDRVTVATLSIGREN